MVCSHVCRVSSPNSKALGSSPLRMRAPRFDEVPAGREPQCRLRSSIFLPDSLFQTLGLLISAALFLHHVCLFLTVRSFPATSKLTLGCFQCLLSRNLWVVDLKNVRIWQVGETFFHPGTMEDMTRGCLKGSPLNKVSVVPATSESSPFLPLDAAKHLLQDLALYSSPTQSSAWHSKFNTHTWFFLFGWKGEALVFSPTSVRNFLWKGGVFIALWNSSN